MHNEFTAIIEKDGDWFISYCPEVPGANGQGRTKEGCKRSLAEAVKLILEDRREEALRGVPEDAIREVVAIGALIWRARSRSASPQCLAPQPAKRSGRLL